MNSRRLSVMGSKFIEDGSDEWAAKMLSKLYGHKVTVDELPSIYNEHRRQRRSVSRHLGEDQVADEVPVHNRRRTRLIETNVVSIPVNKKRSRVRLNSTVISFRPTHEERVRAAF